MQIMWQVGGVLATVALCGCSGITGGRVPSTFSTTPVSKASEATGQDRKAKKRTSREAMLSQGASRQARGSLHASPQQPGDPLLSIPSIGLLPSPGAPPAPPPFPSAADIRSGTTRSTLLKTYGGPTLRLAQVQEGALLEKYVYVRPDHSAATFAQIRDGRVTSAATVPQ